MKRTPLARDGPRELSATLQETEEGYRGYGNSRPPGFYPSEEKRGYRWGYKAII